MIKVRSWRALAAFGLRSASLGSRFVFVVFAAMWMTPTDFGIYGLVASATALITQIAGLEAYQVTLRRVAQVDHDGAMADDRAHYGRFVLTAMAVSALCGAAFGFWFQWSTAIVLLAGGISAAEYLGTEAQRILVVEGRSDQAMFGVSLRFLPWNLGLPVLGLLHLISRGWSAEYVLAWWLISSLLGSVFLVPIAGRYLRRAQTSFGSWMRVLARQVPRWLLIAICYRFLEVGMRLVPGILISEQAAGTFVFFSTIASIGCTGLKAAIEPFWFVRMIREDAGRRARREFGFVTAAWLALGAVVSVGALYAATRSGHHHVGPGEMATFGVLLLASAMLSASQVPHFALYAAEADRTIQNISGIVLVVSLFASFVGTALFGLIGTALGTLLGSSLLFALKCGAAVRMGGDRNAVVHSAETVG